MSRRRKGHATNDELIRVLVTPDLKKRATRLANAADLSLSAWMRSLAIREVEAANHG